MDLTRWPRKKACLVCCVAMMVLTLPCALGWSVLSGVQPFGPGTTIQDLEDFIVTNLLLPLGSLIIVLFCTSRYGWGWEKFTEEANSGKGLKVPKWMRPYTTYVLPAIVLIIFFIGLYDFFA